MADEPNEIDATSKAVEETAKTTGKAIDASSKLGQWLGQIFGDLVEDSVGLASDRLKYYRLDNLIKTREKFSKKWQAKGLKVSMPLPTGVAIKLIEEVSLAENDSLQELWANLLVNGMDPNFGESIERSHVNILAQLNPYDASIFDVLLKNFCEDNKASFTQTQYTKVSLVNALMSRGPVSEEDVELSLRRLFVLGLIRPGVERLHGISLDGKLPERYMDLEAFGVTLSGYHLFKAVS